MRAESWHLAWCQWEVILGVPLVELSILNYTEQDHRKMLIDCFPVTTQFILRYMNKLYFVLRKRICWHISYKWTIFMSKTFVCLLRLPLCCSDTLSLLRICSKICKKCVRLVDCRSGKLRRRNLRSELAKSSLAHIFCPFAIQAFHPLQKK